MANVGFQTIAEFSELVVEQFQHRWGAAIAAAQKFNEFTQEIIVDQEGVIIPFINSWEGLKEIGLHDNPTGTTFVAEYMQAEIKRFNRFAVASVYDWADAKSRSLVMNQLDAIVAEGAFLRSRRIIRALQLGDTSAIQAYDGQNLFSNSHTVNGNSFDNLLTGLSLNTSGFNQARLRLQQIPLGPDGTYLPTEGATFTLIIPPALDVDAELLLNSTTIYEDNKNATNPMKSAAQKIVSNQLTDDNDWYLLMSLGSIKPFVTVKHSTSTDSLIPFIADTDLNVVKNKLYEWHLDKIENTVPVHFYQMVKVVNS